MLTEEIDWQARCAALEAERDKALEDARTVYADLCRIDAEQDAEIDRLTAQVAHLNAQLDQHAEVARRHQEAEHRVNARQVMYERIVKAAREWDRVQEYTPGHAFPARQSFRAALADLDAWEQARHGEAGA